MSDKKTIAFYIGSLCKGGAERVMVNLASYFDTEGYKVYLVTKAKDEPEYEVPKGVTRLLADIEGDEISNSRPLNLYRRIMKLRRIWKKIQPDIIVSFIRKNNLMAIASSRGLKIPVVVSVRSNPARELAGKVMKPLSLFMFRFADGIVLQTSQAKEFFPKHIQKKSVIMKNSITEQFMSIKPEPGLRKEIVSVGRIDSNKNQKMLLEAFSNIAKDYPEWSLHLYGDGEDAEELKRGFLSNNEIANQIIFHGVTDDVPSSIRNASIFVLPSKQEGMPNALIEAMVLKLACISTDCPCGGPADLIQEGKNGYLVPVDDVKELQDRLCELIDNEKLRREIGDNAGKIREIVNPEVVNQAWKEYLLGFIN